MKPKVVKDPKRLLAICNELRPLSAKLLLFLAFIRQPYVPFKMTYFDMSQHSQIKNPARVVDELVERGYLKKELVDRNENQYTLLVDLVADLEEVSL